MFDFENLEVYQKSKQFNKSVLTYGKKRWEQLCDVVQRFEDGIVSVEKNRFGKIGEYRVG